MLGSNALSYIKSYLIKYSSLKRITNSNILAINFLFCVLFLRVYDILFKYLKYLNKEKNARERVVLENNACRLIATIENFANNNVADYH